MAAIMRRTARQARLIDGCVWAGRCCCHDACAVIGTLHRDGQRRRRLVAIGILHHVVEREVLGKPAAQRLRRRPAVVEHIAPAAIAVLRQRAVAVELRHRCGIRTPGDKALGRISARHIVAQYIAGEGAGGTVFYNNIADIIDGLWPVIHDADVQRRTCSISIAVGHGDCKAILCGIARRGRFQRIAVAITGRRRTAYRERAEAPLDRSAIGHVNIVDDQRTDRVVTGGNEEDASGGLPVRSGIGTIGVQRGLIDQRVRSCLNLDARCRIRLQSYGNGGLRRISITVLDLVNEAGRAFLTSYRRESE
ncbi:hypothetical protein SPHS6_00150 [Sphingobium sp. S6]|nr:hypothetical protein SPHS6_00150 [Sphingobium sp. S6]